MRKRAQNDWRLNWYAGLIALHAGDYPTAAREFDLVYSSLPGEIAPRLALAASYELAGDRSAATRRYERVWLVDRSYPSAAFGLARMRTAAGDRVGAIAVLDQVPGSSSQYVSAQVASFRASIDRAVGTIAQDDLVEASDRLDRLKLDAMRQATLSIEIFEAALAWIAERGGQIGTGALFGHRMTERELRLGLERAYRVLASLETDTRARHALVDRANAARPWTMV
jgi:serine/threonine-protein kinase PknG